MMIKNPDRDYLNNIRTAIRDNDGYCPCVLQRNEDTKCPCRNFRDKNICHCGLYVEDKNENS